MKKILLLLCVALLCVGTSVYAQENGGFSVHFGPTIPLGDFGGNDSDEWIYLGEEQGCASLGINVGAKYKFALPVDGLGITAGVDVFFNGMNKCIKEDVYEEMEDLKFDITSKPRYFNIPIMVGVNYQYSINRQFGIFAQAGIGADIRYITPMIMDNWTNIEYKDKYSTAINFAGEIGVGVVFNNKISLGLNFEMLGSSKIKATQYIDGDKVEESKSPEPLKTNMMAIQIGFML